MLYHRLKDLREDHDLTQAKTAEILGTVREQYRKYESGIQELHMHHFITLARYYNVSLDYLAGLTDLPRTLDGKPYQVTGKNVVTFNAPIKGNIDIH